LNRASIAVYLSLVLVLSIVGLAVPAVAVPDIGYNWKARIFVGTGMQWCMEKVGDPDWCQWYLGDYANDKVVMKWNAEWDRGSAESWANPPYAAWENNEWNGRFPGGSGAVWHYKIKWVGPCTDYEFFPDGGYCLWGQFEVLMDQGSDPAYCASTNHCFVALAKPNGYGT
jgi:hypothetical protein